MPTNSLARRASVLAFITEQTATTGRPPTLEEIAAACGFASRSAASRHVKALQVSGELAAPEPGKSRAARPKAALKTESVVQATIFEVTAGDVRQLNDGDLRELVARLFMARLSDKGYPPDPVTWGGDQRASDGGIDVSVNMPAAIAADVELNNSPIGVQVKAEPMGAKKIQEEMCPGGILRPAIRDLVKARGSYLIFSNESCAHKAYIARVDAMKKSIGEEDGAADFIVDFYDARRIANWANCHPGIVAWLRGRVGRILQGWRSFEQWSNLGAAKQLPFIDDPLPRLKGSYQDPGGMNLTDGLQKVRRILAVGGNSVRLAGLSGVGKTRFAKAIFEEAAIEGALSVDLSVYTDLSDSPVPSPHAVLEELMVNKKRAVLIIDNCGHELHRSLAARCLSSSTISLLTIEYDIREESLEGAEVFYLDAGSDELITKVVKAQFPSISEVTIDVIAKFAAGNSRVAIALARTVGKKDSLVGIGESGLFERLFWQRQAVDEGLLNAAKACSLVYSMNVEDLDGEMRVLSELAEISSSKLYRQIEELARRGLVQKRGPWRAILPKAIADTLAERALSSTHSRIIEGKLIEPGGRLLKSFSRRLGYLHESNQAVDIVRSWLRKGGLLGDLKNLDDLNAEVLENVAPVDLEATLTAIEGAASGGAFAAFEVGSNQRRVLIKILRKVCWDATYFKRCLDVLLQFALQENEEERFESTRNVMYQLFRIYLSGTHASADQRRGWIRDIAKASDVAIVSIAMGCLHSALQAANFSSHSGFDFGSRPRDYGYLPRVQTEIRQWYEKFIELAIELGTQLGRVGELAREVLAKNFRSLWMNTDCYDLLESACQTFSAIGWDGGWNAVVLTRRYGFKSMSRDAWERLAQLEVITRPTNLVEEVRAFVLSGNSSGIDFGGPGEDVAASYRSADDKAAELGSRIADDFAAVESLAPDLMKNRQGRQYSFGRGLADSVGPDKLWALLVKAFEETSKESRNVQVLRGFLNRLGETNLRCAGALIDSCMKNSSLVVWAPLLQMALPFDSDGFRRLIRLIRDDEVPVSIFRYIGHGRTTEMWSDDWLVEILSTLAQRENGLEVALDILSMHFYGSNVIASSGVTKLAIYLLENFAPRKGDNGLDHHVALLVKKFFVGSDREASARVLLKRIRQEFDNYKITQYDIDDVVAALFEVQPRAALDELVGDEPNKGKHYVRRNRLASSHARNPLASVSKSELIEWCSGGSKDRWSGVAAVIPSFEEKKIGSDLKWSELALGLVTASPNPAEVAEVLIESLRPMSWSGSRAQILLDRIPLLEELTNLLGENFDERGKVLRRKFDEAIEEERRLEQQRHQDLNERFE